jgi:hypothetical protein
MARQEKQSRQQKTQMDAHQRQVRRGQVIMAIFSIIIIVSMLIGLLINI